MLPDGGCGDDGAGAESAGMGGSGRGFIVGQVPLTCAGAGSTGPLAWVWAWLLGWLATVGGGAAASEAAGSG